MKISSSIMLLVIILIIPVNCFAGSWEMKINTPNGYIRLQEGEVIAAGIGIGAVALIYFGSNSDFARSFFPVESLYAARFTRGEIFLPLFTLEF